ncbi:tyrosine-type recombinase/integrase [Pseudomonas putida]|uniref:tyrosine-type recombinase/integrase n=1 Tax=Pseudomonas TaxID=286 RepID=UPI0018D7C9CB|nr:site-specific integrase [Pseudomonas putida]MBH3472188.1 site-specific integrase [Pseudomonas putida]MDD2121078.1 site-specific integrase [Pseudomonas putida]UPU91301.1 site-specific integrase [Pseudomonas putida]HDS1731181.1 site-specific integrase [Pseudomonas putida]
MVVLVNDEGQPLFLPNVYVTLRYRDVGSAATTIEKVLRSIGMAYLWAAARKIDLHKALSSEEFLSTEQCEDLAFFLRLDRFAQDQIVAQSVNPQPRKVTRLEQVRAGASSIAPRTMISPLEGGYRIRTVANFLRFNHERIKPRAPAKLRKDFTTARELAIANLRALEPRAVSADEGDALEGLGEDTMELLDKAFEPGSELNPFQSAFHQHRNSLMYWLFSETAIRRSELRYLRVEDIDHVSRRVKVRVSKTIARTLPISEKTSDEFHAFVMGYWAKIPVKARKHGYLFTTAEGEHISLGAINLIFREMRQKLALPDNVAPHALRRTWNDRLSRKIDSLPPEQRMKPEAEKQLRNRMNGWSKNSNMTERYARRHIREKADRIAEDLANELRDKEV